jgi:glycerate dehydrogenase
MNSVSLVVLDGYTLNPGDLDWSPLRQLGACAIYDRTPEPEILPRAQAARIVLTNKTPLSAATLGQLPALKYIGVLATGYNVVDVAAATRRGIVVANVPAYSTASVAQLVFAFLLEWTHRTGQHADSVRRGRWCASPDFAYWESPLIELEGRVLGIVGLGQIGRAVARIGQAFGMKILATTRHPRPLPEGVERVALDDLFRQADVVTLHCPLTEETRGLVDARRLALMKPGAFLINTSRGPVVVEADLAAALNAGRIAGAGLDVLSTEPPKPENPLLAAPRCWITPHVAWATLAARERLLRAAVDNVRGFLAGRPQNVVNPR